MEWETVIGLEIHAQLATKSKIFSAASTAFGAEPNTQACAIDLGMPGVLPVLNQDAVRMAVMFGLAIEAEIGEKSVFARKNYFYPDLPKGYQISPFEWPGVGTGPVEIDLEDGETKRIGVTRAHLEEDAGKSLHEDFQGASGIDLNRAGTPLLEIVSEPDLRSAAEAIAYAKKIHSLVRYLEICDGNMQEGSFRMDVNVSLRPKGQDKFGTRAEIKNLNSFRFMDKAIAYEVERQADILESGGKVIQETRLYDTVKGETRSMRGKEEANDYRYFPDPDLLPLIVDAELKAQVREQLPELPDEKRERFVLHLGLSRYDAGVLTSSRELADYYEVMLAEGVDAKLSANWVMGDLAAFLNKDALEITQSPVSAQQLAQLVARISDNTLSGTLAKKVFEHLWNRDGETVDAIIESKGLKQISDSGALEQIIDAIMAANPQQVEQFRAGKDKLMGFFVGQAMKASKGQANPAQLNELLKKKLAG